MGYFFGTSSKPSLRANAVSAAIHKPQKDWIATSATPTRDDGLKVNRGILLCLFVVLFALSAHAADAQTPPNTVVVRGEALIKIPVERAQIAVAVEVRGKTATEVNKALALAADKLMAGLKAEGATVTTGSVDLRPDYQYDNNRQRLNGFIGSYAVTATTKQDKAGTLIDAAFTSGATMLNGITFTATDENVKKAADSALQDAVRDGVRRAELILAPLGKKPGAVLDVRETGDVPPPPMPQQGRGMLLKAAEAVPTPIAPEAQSVGASVMLTIAF